VFTDLGDVSELVTDVLLSMLAEDPVDVVTTPGHTEAEREGDRGKRDDHQDAAHHGQNEKQVSLGTFDVNVPNSIGYQADDGCTRREKGTCPCLQAATLLTLGALLFPTVLELGY
jgi:hypothetical protein